ncbi:MAG TPA: hypothetical protein VI316_12325, partial [Candidatus Dormibacteraeota bacterium]
MATALRRAHPDAEVLVVGRRGGI